MWIHPYPGAGDAGIGTDFLKSDALLEIVIMV